MPLATAANSDTDTHLAQKYHLRATLPHRGCGIPNDLAPDWTPPPPAAQPLGHSAAAFRLERGTTAVPAKNNAWASPV